MKSILWIKFYIDNEMKSTLLEQLSHDKTFSLILIMKRSDWEDWDFNKTAWWLKENGLMMQKLEEQRQRNQRTPSKTLTTIIEEE